MVLTGEAALMSDYGGSTQLGFTSALPESWIRGRIEKLLFPIKSDEKGRVDRSPYGIAKVEATLLRHGFRREDIIIADPRKLELVVGPNTKVLGITTMDPLGVSYGIGVVNMMLQSIGIRYDGRPYISKGFFDIVEHPSVRRFRPKLIVGGAAAWQLVDAGNHQPVGVDTVFEGEFEKDGWKLFKDAVNGAALPQIYHGGIPDLDEIPYIVTPSIGGEVEISRGCGRGCKFCTPTLLRWVCMPYDHIEQEIRFNLDAGTNHIGLHSEEFFKYGSSNPFRPNREHVTALLGRVEHILKEYHIENGEGFRVTTDFTTAVSAVSDPGLVQKAGETINPGGTGSYIEMGIETGSPRMIDVIMPGKVRPFTSKEYPDIVEQAVGILNDNRWIVVGTMIVNFPGETEDDVLRSIELVERLKDAKVLIWPLPFIPMGGLRKRGWTILRDILDDPVKNEFLLRGLNKTFDTLSHQEWLPTDYVESRFNRYALKLAAYFCIRYMKGKLSKELERNRYMHPIPKEHEIENIKRHGA
ncbi:MAG: radical SAM protein [Methanomassiliicoccales archaeon]